MLPFIGFVRPDIFGNEFWSNDKDFADLERIIHEASDGSEGGNGFAKSHFDENTGGWVLEDVIHNLELIVMQVVLIHFVGFRL